MPLKADPFGFAAELRPSTASIVADTTDFDLDRRRLSWPSARQGEARRKPMSIYEVHLGSWRRGEDGGFLTYDELADQLIPYAVGLGFTHLELLPVSEHPLDESWGYQPIGLFAPTSRFGDARGFRAFRRQGACGGLGVILDWVPAHFPVDAHGLARFDGEPLYEHADPRKGFHPDWNTAIYDFGRKEVANFLLASALYWVDRFHIDGLRVDAVASMLYLDYSRKAGEWLPNAEGGNENHDAIAFLKRANEAVYGEFPGAVTIAEESTAFPGVSKPTNFGGLGFGFKWNMGWMHDTLDYMSRDPIYRRWGHDKMTFGLLYAFTENFVLPISHDEVVHGKALGGRQDARRRMAALRQRARLLRLHVGASRQEAAVHGPGVRPDQRMELQRVLALVAARPSAASGPAIAGQRPQRALSRRARRCTRATARPRASAGSSSTTTRNRCSPSCAWARRATRRSRSSAISRRTSARDYRVGLPSQGRWRETLNTDSSIYGGSNVGNFGGDRRRARARCTAFPPRPRSPCRRWRRSISNSSRNLTAATAPSRQAEDAS